MLSLYINQMHLNDVYTKRQLHLVEHPFTIQSYSKITFTWIDHTGGCRQIITLLISNCSRPTEVILRHSPLPSLFWCYNRSVVELKQHGVNWMQVWLSTLFELRGSRSRQMFLYLDVLSQHHRRQRYMINYIQRFPRNVIIHPCPFWTTA